jgi:hypothetical protein
MYQVLDYWTEGDNEVITVTVEYIMCTSSHNSGDPCLLTLSFIAVHWSLVASSHEGESVCELAVEMQNNSCYFSHIQVQICMMILN